MSCRVTQRLCAILVLVTAAGCGGAGSSVDPESLLSDWFGFPDSDLVLKFGAPDAVYAMQDGGRILTWRRSRSENQGGEVYTVTETHTVDGKDVLVPVTRQKPAVTLRYDCVVNFVVDPDGYIVGHTEQGNDCVGLPLPD